MNATDAVKKPSHYHPDPHPSQHDLEGMDQAARDAQDLAALGHAETLTRKFDKWSMLALAFCVLGTWTTSAQSLATGIINGGPVTVVWGLCLVTLCNLCVALSLGELCSAMPTALGQAYWVIRTWETSTGRFASYMCAWINTFGWWTLTASQNAFMTDFFLGMKLMYDPDWKGASKGWVQFLVYVGVTVAFTAFNHVACRNDRVLPAFNNFVAVGFVGLFIALGMGLPIAVGTRSDEHFQNAKFVFGEWINRSGWNGFVTFFLGLAQSAYSLTAFDSVIHMVEEIPAPRKNGPLTMYLAIICGWASGWVFMVICLFCIQDVDRVLDSDLPFIDLVEECVGRTGAAVFIGLFIFNGLGQGISILTSASRLTWSFARDGGMPFFGYFAQVDPYWKAPVRSLWLQAVIIIIVGVLYLFANTVLSAIFSVSTIALTISYAIPISIVLIKGRKVLPPGGEFSLGKWGPFVNWVSMAYCITTTIFFFFPPEPNPAPSDMNYAIAVFGVMIVVSLAFWFIKGKKSFMQTSEMADVLYANGSDSPQPGDSSTHLGHKDI